MYAVPSNSYHSDSGHVSLEYYFITGKIRLLFSDVEQSCANYESINLNVDYDIVFSLQGVVNGLMTKFIILSFSIYFSRTYHLLNFPLKPL